MLLLILLLVILFCSGFVFLDRHTFSLNLLEKFFFSIIIAAVFYALLVFLFALGLKSLLVPLAITSVLGIIFCILNYRSLLKMKKIPVQLKKNRMLGLVVLLFFGVFLFQYFVTLLPSSASGWQIAKNPFGDTPIHLGFISSFVYGKNFTLQNPFYYGENLNYYFLTDFFSSIIVGLGYSFRTALLIPALLFSTVLTAIIILLIKRLGGKNISFLIGPLLFLFNGGLGFIYFLKDSQNKPIIEAFGHISKEYSHIGEKGIFFVNMIGGLLAPERPLLLGTPLFLIILILLISQTNKNKFNKNLLLASFLTGIMPYVHLYFFLTLIGCLLFWTSFDIYYQPKRTKKWLVLFLIIFIFSSWSLISTFFSISGRNYLKLNFGWLKKPGENIVFFWIKNLSLVPFVVLAALISKKIKPRIKLYFYPFVLLFIIINIFSFQPYAWDNVKFLIPVYLCSSILVGLYLEKLFWENFLYKLFVTGVLFLCTFTGFISYLGEVQTTYLLFSNYDLQLGQFIRENTDPGDVFLAKPTNSNPAVALAGRTILMGYPGYLWTQGIDYEKREKDVIKMLDSDNLEEFNSLADSYNLSYLVFEKDNLLSGKDHFFLQNFLLVYQNDKYNLFKLR